MTCFRVQSSKLFTTVARNAQYRLKGRRKKSRGDLIPKEEGLRQGKDENEESDCQKIAKDGKRWRKEREDALRRDRQHEVGQNRYQEKYSEQTTPELPTNQSSISAVDRTVITRWPQEEQPGETFLVGQDQIKGFVFPHCRNRFAALDIWKNPWFAVVVDIWLILAQHSRAPHVLYFRINSIVSGPPSSPWRAPAPDLQLCRYPRPAAAETLVARTFEVQSLFRAYKPCVR